MADDQVREYIKQCRDQGIAESDIRQALADAGWEEPQIQTALQPRATTMTAQSQPKKKHRILRTFLLTVLIIGGTAAFLYFSPTILSWFVSDIDQIDDADLALQTLDIPAEQNSFLDAADLKPLHGDLGSFFTYVNAEKGTDEENQALLTTYSPAIAKFESSLRKPFWQDPNYASNNPDIVKTEDISTWRIASDLFRLRAKYLAEQGQAAVAASDLIALAQLGQRIQSGQNSLVESLVGISIQQKALESLQKIAKSLDPQVSQKARADIQLLQTNPTNMFKSEYRVRSIDLAQLAGKTPSVRYQASDKIVKPFRNDYSFQLNQTKSLLAGNIRDVIKFADQPCNFPDPKSPSIERFPFALVPYLKNGLGRMVHARSVAIEPTIMRKTCQVQLMNNATIAVLALRSYEQKYGSLPARLDLIVPEFLSTLPLDPYSNQSFVYSPEKKVIYSVGPDRLDKGGSTSVASRKIDWFNQDNPTFYLD